MLEITVEEFDEAVADALDGIPAELLALMDNVVFLVEDEPPSDDPELLGVYDHCAAEEIAMSIARLIRSLNCA